MSQTQSDKSSVGADDIDIRVIQEKDGQRVLDFLRKYFFPYEPLTLGSEPKDDFNFGGEFLISSIKHGTSLMAFRKGTDELLGLSMTGPKNPDELASLKAEVERVGTNSKYGKILQFISVIDKQADVCNRYNVQKVLYIIATCVNVKMRGKGIGARLYTAVEELGKQKGFELLTSDCTSFYSARIKDQLGWDCINAIYYKDYVDENKQQVFRPDPPHVCCKTFALRL